MKLLQLTFRAFYGLYAWLVTLLLLPPLWILTICLPGLHLRRRCAGFSIRLIAWMIFVPIKTEGQEQLPAGPAVLVTNHISYLDGPIMLMTMPPRFSFVVKAEAAKVPVVALLLRRMGATFVSRDNAAQGSTDMRHLMRTLRNGQSLGLFPEGRIQRQPGLQPFRLGAFLIAAHCGVPVVPAVIRGTRNFMPRNYWWPTHGTLSIHLLPAIVPDGNDREAAVRLCDKAYAAVLAHCEESAALQLDPEPGVGSIA